MEWVATYKNPKMGETNTYLVTDEVLLFMDDVVYVDKNDNTKVIDPKRFDSVGNTIPVKCLWLHDMNKGHDTLRRTWLGMENNLSI